MVFHPHCEIVRQSPDCTGFSEGTQILLDEQECTQIGKEFIISEGEHKIKFAIGNYEITRSITAIKGKTYSANFSLDLEITEK